MLSQHEWQAKAALCHMNWRGAMFGWEVLAVPLRRRRKLKVWLGGAGRAAEALQGAETAILSSFSPFSCCLRLCA